MLGRNPTIIHNPERHSIFITRSVYFPIFLPMIFWYIYFYVLQFYSQPKPVCITQHLQFVANLSLITLQTLPGLFYRLISWGQNHSKYLAVLA